MGPQQRDSLVAGRNLPKEGCTLGSPSWALTTKCPPQGRQGGCCSSEGTCVSLETWGITREQTPSQHNRGKGCFGPLLPSNAPPQQMHPCEEQKCQALSWGRVQHLTHFLTLKHRSSREHSQKGDAHSVPACSKGHCFEGEINKPLF